MVKARHLQVGTTPDNSPGNMPISAIEIAHCGVDKRHIHFLHTPAQWCIESETMVEVTPKGKNAGEYRRSHNAKR